MLSPTLGSIESLYGKLEREAYRAIHSASKVHQADHFFNFCVTAHAMRDYFLERIGKTARSERREYHEEWRNHPLLIAVGEIANSSKHFVLRYPSGLPKAPKTRNVSARKSSVIDIYAASDGRLVIKRRPAPTIEVTLEDGRRFALHAFMRDVLAFWREFLPAHSIKVGRQSLAQLQGRTSKSKMDR